MRDNRLFNRDLNAVHLMTTFLFLKEGGKTSLPMNTATQVGWFSIAQILFKN